MTPAKRSLDSNANSPQAQLSNDKLSVSIKAKVASVYEPSPASTYGETAGSSVPATPSGNIQPGTHPLNLQSFSVLFPKVTLITLSSKSTKRFVLRCVFRLWSVCA